MIYFGESSMGYGEKRILCCCLMKYSVDIDRSFRFMVSFSFRISLLIFCLGHLYLGDRGLLKSPTTNMLESICGFRSFSVCLIKLGTLTLGAYRLIIVISFWCIAPFISMNCPSLSHLTNVSLKSTLSHITVATLACFQGP
jgi:hypothetical protein